MAKIIIATSGLTGILNASFELIRRLERMGHEVIYACSSDKLQIVQAQGFKAIEVEKVSPNIKLDLPNYENFLGKIRRFLYKWYNRKALQNIAVQQIEPRRFLQAVSDLKPDLILLDIELHAHIFATVGKKMPVLLLSQWFSLWERKGLPPLSHDTIPGEGENGQAKAIQAAWKKIKKQRRIIFAKNKWRSASTDRRSILLKYAEQVGFPKKYIPENFWPGPFTYSQLPVLKLTLQELEFPHDPRPNSHYIGPMVFADRKEVNNSLEIQQKIAVLFQEKENKNKRLIYCSVSTFASGDVSFLNKICAAVAEKENWLLLIGLGGKIQPNSLKKMPKNVHAFSWLPQLAVLEKADLSVNHGGIHTINECLHFQVPMLIYSGKKSDQNGCAARIHYHELGIMANKDTDTVAEINGKINEILTNKKYLNKIKEAHHIYQKYEQSKLLHRIITAHLSKNQIY